MNPPKSYFFKGFRTSLHPSQPAFLPMLEAIPRTYLLDRFCVSLSVFLLLLPLVIALEKEGPFVLLVQVLFPLLDGILYLS